MTAFLSANRDLHFNFKSVTTLIIDIDILWITKRHQYHLVSLSNHHNLTKGTGLSLAGFQMRTLRQWENSLLLFHRAGK